MIFSEIYASYLDFFSVENQNQYLLALAMKTEELSVMMASINTQIDRYIISLDNDIQRKINETSVRKAKWSKCCGIMRLKV